jgi:hypothetical protein
MPRLKLTQRTVEKLPAPDPSARQVLHWDTAMRGFGVLCSGKTNAKTYVVQRDLPDGRTRRVTIAAANVISLDEARRRAQATLAELYRGVDPRISARGSTTLRKVLEDYLASRPLRETTKEEYRRGVERHLKPWLHRSSRWSYLSKVPQSRALRCPNEAPAAHLDLGRATSRPCAG